MHIYSLPNIDLTVRKTCHCAQLHYQNSVFVVLFQESQHKHQLSVKLEHKNDVNKLMRSFSMLKYCKFYMYTTGHVIPFYQALDIINKDTIVISSTKPYTSTKKQEKNVLIINSKIFLENRAISQFHFIFCTT